MQSGTRQSKQTRPTRQQLADARDATLPDVIAPRLRVLFCGINPSLYSAAVQCHFGRPGNRFWPALHQARFTPRLFRPDEQSRLLPLGLGVTNIVDRATAKADALSAEELRAGRAALTRKARKYEPAVVAFLGVTAYRTAFECPEASYGLQEEKLADADVWVLPNPSGANAHHQLADIARMLTPLKRRVSRSSGVER